MEAYTSYTRWFLTFFTTMIIVAIIVSGCGSHDLGKKSSNASYTTTTSTPEQKMVTITVPNSKQALGKTISVVLTNRGTETILIPNGQTNCTIVLLELSTNGGWQAIDKCVLETHSVKQSLKSGEHLTVQLTPQGTPWSAGPYRAVIQYSYEQNPSKGLLSLVSSEFEIS